MSETKGLLSQDEIQKIDFFRLLINWTKWKKQAMHKDVPEKFRAKISVNPKIRQRFAELTEIHYLGVNGSAPNRSSIFKGVDNFNHGGTIKFVVNRNKINFGYQL